jgi:hypothetical protein
MFPVAKLPFLRRTIDSVVDQIAWLGLIAVFGTSIAMASAETITSNRFNVGRGLLITIAIAVAIAAIWKGRGTVRWVTSGAFLAKRYFYRRLRAQTPLGGRAIVTPLAGAVISEHFTSIRFNRRDQAAVADRLVQAIKAGTKLAFIEGVSGAGKTAAALITVDKLLTSGDAEISDIARRVLYYDLAASPDSIKSFIDKCNSGLLHDACVIVDNFHRIEPERLEAFSETIETGLPQCRVLLVLTQPLQFVTLSPSANIDAFNIAEKSGAWLTLVPPQSLEIHRIFPNSACCDSISDALDNLGVPRDDAFRWVAHASLERVFQFARHEGEQALLDLIGAKLSPDSERSRLLLRLIAAISALSIHRGVFSAEDLDAAFGALAPSGWQLNGARQRLRAEFQRLRRNGFILEAVGRRRIFVFHQTLAEHFKDHFIAEETFREAFEAVGVVLKTRAWVRDVPLMAWLYAIELNDAAGAHRSFASALCSGAYAMMRRALLRNMYEPAISTLTYEQGVLAEKVGEWTEARSALRNFVSTVEGDDNARAKAIIALIEAEHGPNSRSELREIANSTAVSHFLRLSARYWVLHLDAHEGAFDAAGLDDVLNALEKSRADLASAHGYDFLHLARRVFFDRVRYHYLIGNCSGRVISELDQRPMSAFLATHHVAFNAYREKFILGHSIHYDYVFQLGVLGIRPAIDNAILPSDAGSDIESMISAAIGYYESSMARFSVFGDKTKEYIKPRLLEVKMMQHGADLERLLPDLNAYNIAVQESGLADLAPYPYVYLFKLHFKMAFEALLMSTYHADNAVGTKFFDAEFERARASLAKADALFSVSRNVYGKAMCRMFWIAVTALEQRDFEQCRERLAALGVEAQERGYERILAVVRYLEGNKPTAHDLIRIVTYFPLVHQ